VFNYLRQSLCQSCCFHCQMSDGCHPIPATPNLTRTQIQTLTSPNHEQDCDTADNAADGMTMSQAGSQGCHQLLHHSRTLHHHCPSQSLDHRFQHPYWEPGNRTLTNHTQTSSRLNRTDKQYNTVAKPLVWNSLPPSLCSQILILYYADIRKCTCSNWYFITEFLDYMCDCSYNFKCSISITNVQ